MPDESCRMCGGALVLISKCSDCRKPLEQACTNCENILCDAVHLCSNGKLVGPMSNNAWTMCV